MATKDWKKSGDNLWFYKPGEKTGYHGESKPSATLNAVKWGTDYSVYYDKKPSTMLLKPIKVVSTKKKALAYMIAFMRKN